MEKMFYSQEYLYKGMLLKDKSWCFGMDSKDVPDFLGVYGWRVLEHLSYEKLAERYVKPNERELLSMAIGRMVCVKKL